MNITNITNELGAGEDRYQGETCDCCGKFYRYTLNLLQEPNWGRTYELCRKCTKIRKENGRPAKLDDLIKIVKGGDKYVR